MLYVVSVIYLLSKEDAVVEMSRRDGAAVFVFIRSFLQYNRIPQYDTPSRSVIKDVYC